MFSTLKSAWRRWMASRTRAAAILVTATPPATCCPECRASNGQALADKLSHLVRAHLDVEERWLLKLLMNHYHLNDLCAILGAGPDTVRYRVTALRAKILVLLNGQHADECVKRSFHRMISGSWF